MDQVGQRADGDSGKRRDCDAKLGRQKQGRGDYRDVVEVRYLRRQPACQFDCRGSSQNRADAGGEV